MKVIDLEEPKRTLNIMRSSARRRPWSSRRTASRSSSSSRSVRTILGFLTISSNTIRRSGIWWRSGRRRSEVVAFPRSSRFVRGSWDQGISRDRRPR